MRTVYRHEAFDIELQQSESRFDSFAVRYGKQLKTDLNYIKAAMELGAVMMHALSCEGHMENRTSTEARKAGDRKPYFAESNPYIDSERHKMLLLNLYQDVRALQRWSWTQPLLVREADEWKPVDAALKAAKEALADVATD